MTKKNQILGIPENWHYFQILVSSLISDLISRYSNVFQINHYLPRKKESGNQNKVLFQMNQ